MLPLPRQHQVLESAMCGNGVLFHATEENRGGGVGRRGGRSGEAGEGPSPRAGGGMVVGDRTGRSLARKERPSRRCRSGSGGGSPSARGKGCAAAAGQGLQEGGAGSPSPLPFRRRSSRRPWQARASRGCSPSSRVAFTAGRGSTVSVAGVAVASPALCPHIPAGAAGGERGLFPALAPSLPSRLWKHLRLSGPRSSACRGERLQRPRSAGSQGSAEGTEGGVGWPCAAAASSLVKR